MLECMVSTGNWFSTDSFNSSFLVFKNKSQVSISVKSINLYVKSFGDTSPCNNITNTKKNFI
jgi:hypothetical protein